MSILNVGKKMTIACPEGFHEMTDDEKGNLNILVEGDAVYMTNPEKHIILTVGCRRAGGLAALVTQRDLIGNVEKNVRKSMKPYRYVFGEPFETSIAGVDSNGFDYTYVAQGIPMYGREYVMKVNNMIYYFNFYTRQSLRDESLAELNAILKTVALS